MLDNNILARTDFIKNQLTIGNVILSLNHIAAKKYYLDTFTAQKIKFSVKDFFSKYDHIRRKLRIWSHLLKKTLMENFIFCFLCSVCMTATTRIDL